MAIISVANRVFTSIIVASAVVSGIVVTAAVVYGIGEKEGNQSSAGLFVSLTCSEPSIFII